MAIRKIAVKGDKILRKKTREVTEVNDHIKEILQDMVDTMRAAPGVGLAAPQVGIVRKMFVAEPNPGEVYYMINPEIYEEEGVQEGDEGCLSVPGLIGCVKRPMKIKMRAMNLEGELKEYEFEDFEARVMCHENDHLNGIIYTDKASNIRKPEYEEEEDR
jgi:peptide deformylase